MSLLDRLLQRQSRLPHTADEELSRQVYVLYGVFANLVSAERLVLEAGKYNALSFLHAEDPRKRLAALARMVFETEDIPVPTDQK